MTKSASSKRGIARRDLLRTGTVAALIVPIALPQSIKALAAAETSRTTTAIGNAFLRIEPSGAVVFSLPRTEMGQSVYTALTMLIAEELEMEPDAITIEIPDGDRARFEGLDQLTGGSTSIMRTWQPLRQGAADARAALVQAAARHWSVDAASCTVANAMVRHPDGTQQLGFGALAAQAAAAPLPKGTPLKPPADFRIIGKSQRRLDSRAKVMGSAEYGLDVRVPGMKVATLAQSPTFGGTLAGFDESAAMAVKGVSQVVALDDAIAVVGDHYWAAKKGLEAANPQWNDGAQAALQQAAIATEYAEASARAGQAAGENPAGDGDIAAAMTGAARIIEAHYEQPYLAHATMEPANCVAHVRSDGCEIWTGSQIPGRAREAVAAALELPVEQVAFHNRLMGGGFGRRLEVDIMLRTVAVARHVDAPVKLVWSREEDIAHDMYRPYYHDHIKAGLDESGRPTGWAHTIAGSSIMARLYPQYFNGVDHDAVEGAVKTPYDLPLQRVAYVREENAVPTSWWRGVGVLRNAFVVESFMDELAHDAGIDPLAYRRSLISDERMLRVLDLAADKSGWGTPVSGRFGRGLAIINAWKTRMACVVEVTEDPVDAIRVTKVTVAVDCGQPVNPLGIEAQIEGGVVFGLTGALFGEITIDGGKVQQSNFHDYRLLRISEAPTIETHIVDSHEEVGGIGEPPVATVMPALANAVFALTGKRVRRLPIVKALID